VSEHWLNGWALILLHFAAFMFLPTPGWVSAAATVVGILSLVWAGLLFTRASVLYMEEASSKIMLFVLLTGYSLYVTVLQLDAPRSLQVGAIILLGAGPLVVTLAAMPRFSHPLRWYMVVLQLFLGAFLISILHRPTYADMALSACLFVVYLNSGIHFLYKYRRASAGALISICGFFLWAAVFVLAPAFAELFPKMPLESEVWNLPKYIVAVGMILVLLEDQITHNKHLALHDELTGLPNRRLFQDRLSSAMERARRNNAQTALLMIDLDRFKQVNDSLGHHTGDLLLQGVSQLFTRRVRRSDTVARTGGDEFAIILESPISPVEAKAVATTLLDMLHQPMRVKDREICVGASVGVAVFPDDAVDMESLCIAADLRMYDEKRANTGNAPGTNGFQKGQHHKPRRESELGFRQ
jgi:diguanylate cyclase (GGDEF)-like protein